MDSLPISERAGQTEGGTEATAIGSEVLPTAAKAGHKRTKPATGTLRVQMPEAMEVLADFKAKKRRIAGDLANSINVKDPHGKGASN